MQKHNDEESVSEPIGIFHKLREEGIKNPMTEDEIDDFVESVRKEERAMKEAGFEIPD